MLEFQSYKIHTIDKKTKLNNKQMYKKNLSCVSVYSCRKRHNFSMILNAQSFNEFDDDKDMRWVDFIS